MVEKALLIAGTGDGPWCPVRGLERIEVEGMGQGDRIMLESSEGFLSTIHIDGVHPVNLAKGKVRIRRLKGSENRVTVRAFGDW